jgi:uncharacterized membrane protein
MNKQRDPRDHTGRPEAPFPAKPGPLGRTGRILFGGFLAWYGLQFLSAWLDTLQQGGLTIARHAYTPVVQKGNLALYALALFCVYFLPVADRRRRLGVAAMLFGLAAGVDYLLTGDWWGLPLAVLLSLTVVAVFLYYALAHILAGLLANPG